MAETPKDEERLILKGIPLGALALSNPYTVIAGPSDVIKAIRAADTAAQITALLFAGPGQLRPGLRVVPDKRRAAAPTAPAPATNANVKYESRGGIPKPAETSLSKWDIDCLASPRNWQPVRNGEFPRKSNAQRLIYTYLHSTVPGEFSFSTGTLGSDKKIYYRTVFDAENETNGVTLDQLRAQMY